MCTAKVPQSLAPDWLAAACRGRAETTYRGTTACKAQWRMKLRTSSSDMAARTAATSPGSVGSKACRGASCSLDSTSKPTPRASNKTVTAHKTSPNQEGNNFGAGPPAVARHMLAMASCTSHMLYNNMTEDVSKVPCSHQSVMLTTSKAMDKTAAPRTMQCAAPVDVAHQRSTANVIPPTMKAAEVAMMATSCIPLCSPRACSYHQSCQEHAESRMMHDCTSTKAQETTMATDAKLLKSWLGAAKDAAHRTRRPRNFPVS
mmetsp:Transcript_23453/g.73108  ORF Transcript_23453/g.73108 Transcript_23453/m.73108 type:complete len:260 (+) Transcript_23453:192-971(+)